MSDIKQAESAETVRACRDIKRRAESVTTTKSAPLKVTHSTVVLERYMYIIRLQLSPLTYGLRWCTAAIGCAVIICGSTPLSIGCARTHPTSYNVQYHTLSLLERHAVYYSLSRVCSPSVLLHMLFSAPHCVGSGSLFLSIHATAFSTSSTLLGRKKVFSRISSLSQGEMIFHTGWK